LSKHNYTIYLPKDEGRLIMRIGINWLMAMVVILTGWLALVVNAEMEPLLVIKPRKLYPTI